MTARWAARRRRTCTSRRAVTASAISASAQPAIATMPAVEESSTTGTLAAEDDRVGLAVVGQVDLARHLEHRDGDLHRRADRRRLPARERPLALRALRRLGGAPLRPE